jgi:hypothetical protein
VALFVLLVVGLIVGQTWLDWRNTRKGWSPPDWVKGTALAGVIAVSLTAATSFASAWIQDPVSQWGTGFKARLFWPELVLLFTMMGIIVYSVRKKRPRLMLLLAGVIVGAFWLGMALLP